MHPSTRWRLSGALALVPLLLPALFLGPALSGRFVPSFRDQSDFFVPAHRYTAARLARGELPLWNSMAGNGETWIGNGQNEIFYPPALVFLGKNPGVASGLFLYLHFGIACLLLLGFLRERGSTAPAAAAGASLFAFSALAVALSAYWNHFAGMAWIPGMAWAAERGLRTRRQQAAFAACLGLTLLAGSPEAALFGTIAAALVFEAGRRRDRARREEEWQVRVRRPGAFFGAFAAGVALGAVELVPLLDTLTRAGRRIAGSGAIPLRQLASLVRPPSAEPYGWLPFGASWVQSLYVSLPALALGAVAVSRSRGGERRLWAALALGALALSVASFPAPFRYPAKLLILVLLALAVLGAEGVDRLRFEGGRWAPLVLLAATAAAEVLARGATGSERLTLGSAGALLALSAFGSAGFRGIVSGLGAGALATHLALSAVPLVRFAKLESFEGRPLATRGKVLTTPDDLLSLWATSALPDEDLRVRRQTDSLEGYTNLPFGVPKATTGSALPSRESARFMAGLRGRKDFLVPAIVSGSREIRFPVGGRLQHVVVPHTLSGVAFFSDAEVEPDWRAGLYRAMSAGFDPLRKLLVERKPANAPRGATEAAGETMAVGSIVSDRPERFDCRIDLSTDLWMYCALSWDPWWRATVDGRPTPIIRADGGFSAIVAPKGEHRVVWEYRPWPFYAGAAISAIALVVLAYLALAGKPIVMTKRAMR